MKSIDQDANRWPELVEFLQSSYEGAANLAGWDRRSLEREQSK